MQKVQQATRMRGARHVPLEACTEGNQQTATDLRKDDNSSSSLLTLCASSLITASSLRLAVSSDCSCSMATCMHTTRHVCVFPGGMRVCVCMCVERDHTSNTGANTQHTVRHGSNMQHFLCTVARLAHTYLCFVQEFASLLQFCVGLLEFSIFLTQKVLQGNVVEVSPARRHLFPPKQQQHTCNSRSRADRMVDMC